MSLGQLGQALLRTSAPASKLAALTLFFLPLEGLEVGFPKGFYRV